MALLESQAATRLAELVPIRYGRMSTSPFAFFRGAALVMASDLAGTPRSGLQAQVCGDAHLSNFGIFASPERSLVFDLNDFDETVPGPWEWDVKRLAASLQVAARQNEYTTAEARAIVLAGVGTYRKAMSQFANMSNLDVWYSKIEVEETAAAGPHRASTRPGPAGSSGTSRRRRPATTCRRSASWSPTWAGSCAS